MSALLQPVPVNEEPTEMEGKKGLELASETQKDDSKNEAHVEHKTMREDQVQNAVKFLSHPRVRGSPIVHRRSFLETKGLSKEEIDEAFHRNPDPPSNKTHGATMITDGKRFIQGQQNVAVPISSEALPVGPLPVVQARSTSHYWSQLFFALGFLVAASTGAGFLFKRFLLQKLKSWLRWVVFEDNSSFPINKNSAKEAAMAAALAAKSASAAATEVADASWEMMKLQSEERHYLSTVIQALEVHTLELTKAMMAMKVAVEAVDKSRQLIPPKNMSLVQANRKWRVMEEEKSMEGLKSTQKALNLTVPSNGFHEQHDVAASNKDTVGPLEMSIPERAPHSASYLKVMEMLARGETPPGIQEVNDKPPNPYQPPSVSHLKPRPKPWQTIRTESNGTLHAKVYNSRVSAESAMKPTAAIDNQRQANDASHVEHNATSFIDSDSGLQWQRQKNVELELESLTHDSIVRPTEIEVTTESDRNNSEICPPPSSSGGKGEGSASVNDQISGRSWVPPPIPKTVMPGADAAIKYQKVERKDEVNPLSIAQESPQISQYAEVEDAVVPASLQPVPAFSPVSEIVVENGLRSETDGHRQEGDPTFQHTSCEVVAENEERVE